MQPSSQQCTSIMSMQSFQESPVHRLRKLGKKLCYSSSNDSSISCDASRLYEKMLEVVGRQQNSLDENKENINMGNLNMSTNAMNNESSMRKNKIKPIPLLNIQQTQQKQLKEQLTPPVMYNQTQRLLKLPHISSHHNTNDLETQRPHIHINSNTSYEQEQQMKMKVLNLLQNGGYHHLARVYVLFQALHSDFKDIGKQDTSQNQQDLENIFQQAVQHIESILEHHYQQVDCGENMMEVAVQCEQSVVTYQHDDSLGTQSEDRMKQYQQKLVQIIKTVYSLKQTIQQLQTSNTSASPSYHNQNRTTNINQQNSIIPHTISPISIGMQKCRKQIDILLSTIKKKNPHLHLHSCQQSQDHANPVSKLDSFKSVGDNQGQEDRTNELNGAENGFVLRNLSRNRQQSGIRPFQINEQMRSIRQSVQQDVQIGQLCKKQSQIAYTMTICSQIQTIYKHHKQVYKFMLQLLFTQIQQISNKKVEKKRQKIQNLRIKSKQLYSKYEKTRIIVSKAKKVNEELYSIHKIRKLTEFVCQIGIDMKQVRNLWKDVIYDIV